MSTSTKPEADSESNSVDRLGRPKLDPLAVRKNRGVRFSENEWQLVEANAKASGLSRTEYVRATSLRRYTTKPRKEDASERIAQLETVNKNLTARLNELGNVVNQVALAANTHRGIREEWQFLPEQVAATLQHVRMAIDEAIIDGDG